MCDTMCVQRSKFEPLESKGQMQATCYSCRFAGALLGAALGMVVASSSQVSVFNLQTLTFELTFAQVCLVNGLIPFFTLFPFLYSLQERYPKPSRGETDRDINGWDVQEERVAGIHKITDVRDENDNADAELEYGEVAADARVGAGVSAGIDNDDITYETKTIAEAQHYTYGYKYTDKQRSVAYGEVLWESPISGDKTGAGAGARAEAGKLPSPSSFHYGASAHLPTLDIKVSIPSPKKNKSMKSRDTYAGAGARDSGTGVGAGLGSSNIYASDRSSPVVTEDTPLFANQSSGNKAVYSTDERSRLSELDNMGDGHVLYYDDEAEADGGRGGGGDGGAGKRTIAKQLDDIWNTIQLQSVWSPMIFIYVYNVLQIPNVAWQSFLQLTLKFSPHLLGLSVCLGSLMTFIGVLTYKYYYFDATWRSIYIWSTLLCAFFSMLQILLIFGINRTVFGIGNYWFSMGDDVISAYIAGIQFLPVCIMYMGLCPTGSEGASYAILTTMGNIALNIANTLGNQLSGIWDVSNEALAKGEMSGLWRLTTLTSLLSILPLLLVGLLPKNAETQANLANTQKRSRLGGQIFLTILVSSLCWVFLSSLYSILAPDSTDI